LALLTNLGWIPWDFWREAWRYWPALLILLGLEVLVSGRASWGSAVLAAILLAALGLGATASAFVSWVERPVEPGSLVSSVQQPPEGALAADVSLRFGAGHLEIGAGASQGLLAEASTQSEQRSPLVSRYTVRDGVGYLTLRLAQGFDFGHFMRGEARPNVLNLKLSPDVPFQRLEVDAGAVDATLDLGELQVRRVDIETGASRTHVRLPAHGEVNATIKAGASNLTVEVPQGVSARIRVEAGVSGLDVDTQRFAPSGRDEGVPGIGFEREFRSADYDTAPDRVDLRISAGASSVQVR
jgi:hypothetical protein